MDSHEDVNPILDLEARAKAAGVDVEDICKLAKVARSTLTRAKNATTEPRYSTVKKLEKAFRQLQEEKSVNENIKESDEETKVPVSLDQHESKVNIA